MEGIGDSLLLRSDVNARYDKAVELVERMFDPSAGSGQALHKQLPKAKTPHEPESLKRTVAGTDTQIDALVYELYGPTEDEVGTLEGERG